MRNSQIYCSFCFYFLQEIEMEGYDNKGSSNKTYEWWYHVVSHQETVILVV